MNFATWNVRELNKSSHQKEVTNFISNNSLSFMCCVETKVKVHNSSSILKQIANNWSWIFNYESHYNGRIWIGWDPNVWHVGVHSTSAQHITCFITFIENQVHFCFNFVYALNKPWQRIDLWEDIISLSNLITGPWSIMGDFNSILDVDEALGSNERWTPDMQSFRDCIATAGLGHINTVGSHFTWTNKRLNDLNS